MADALRLLSGFFEGLPRERFVAVGFSAGNLPLICIALDGLHDRVDVPPDEVVLPLIHAGAKSAIFAHNHPSGRCEPSPADKSMTRQYHAALSGAGIRLYDHLIFTPSSCLSMLQGLSPVELPARRRH